MGKYIPVKDGEWVQPRRKDYSMACCDCGLIHKINFRIVNGRIQFQAFRDQRATGQHRRGMNFWNGFLEIINSRGLGNLAATIFIMAIFAGAIFIPAFFIIEKPFKKKDPIA